MERTKVKEALMVVASAWAVAFIVLFLASVGFAPDRPSPERVDIMLFLMVGAITGSGWLRFRHDRKKAVK